MFNIGTGEIAFIALAALILLGPKGLPELARGIGKFMREFRRQTDEVRTVVEREFYRMDQDLSLKDAPDVPPVVAANSVARKSAGAETSEPEALPAPGPDEGPSQLTKGMPVSDPAGAPSAEPSAPSDAAAASTDPGKTPS
jgi:sec-independent protein translocase protein TatB